MPKNICGILIFELGSVEEADKMTETMKNCPNIAVLGTSSNTVYSVCVVPENKRWWLEYPERNPKGVGANRATVHIFENVVHPKSFKQKLPKKRMKIAPCGADCKTCPLRQQYSCSGCPATIHYKQTRA